MPSVIILSFIRKGHWIPKTWLDVEGTRATDWLATGVSQSTSFLRTEGEEATIS